MGQAYSISSLNPEQYPSIQISAKGCFSDCSTTKFPFDEKPQDVQDSFLWDDFGRAIDEHLPKLNRYAAALWIIYSIVVAAIVVSMQVVVRTTEVAASAAYVGILMIPLVFGFTFGQYPIIRRNQEVDGVIADICAEYDLRFQQHGYSPEYRTKWNTICKPRGARAMRLIVFRSAAKPMDP